MAEAAKLFGQTKTSETDQLGEQLAIATKRTLDADEWFGKHGPEHPKWAQAGKRMDEISQQLGLLTGRAFELGLYWDGEKLIPWADAFNPAAANKQPATLFTGTQTQDLSDLE